MQIGTQNTQINNLQQNKPATVAKEAPKQESQEQVEAYTSSEKDASDVGWLDVGKGLVGAVATAAIEGVGNTISSVPQAIELAVEGEVALVKNKTLGPWIKTGIGLLTATAAVPLAIAATAVGSLGYGLFRGFSEGVKGGVGAAIKAGVEDVRDFNTELASGAREGIREFGNETLDEDEEAFDVSPVRAGVGLLAGVGTTIQGTAQFGLTTLKHIPGGFIQANKAISKSDASTPLKFAGHALTLPLAVLAAPLGIVGGAIVGLGFGVYEGYREGFTDSFKGVNELNKSYDKVATEAMRDAGEDIID